MISLKIMFPVCPIYCSRTPFWKCWVQTMTWNPSILKTKTNLLEAHSIPQLLIPTGPSCRHVSGLPFKNLKLPWISTNSAVMKTEKAATEVTKTDFSFSTENLHVCSCPGISCLHPKWKTCLQHIHPYRGSTNNEGVSDDGREAVDVSAEINLDHVSVFQHYLGVRLQWGEVAHTVVDWETGGECNTCNRKTAQIHQLGTQTVGNLSRIPSCNSGFYTKGRPLVKSNLICP